MKHWAKADVKSLYSVWLTSLCVIVH